MSSFNSPSTPNFDDLLLRSLLSKLHLNPPPSSSSSLDDLLLSSLSALSDSDSDSLNPDPIPSDRSQLAREEAKLEKEIIKVILSGKIEGLKPNSGQAVSVGEHDICVGFHEEEGSDYRVWEWHGHVMLFDEENGYVPEYVYGNYFERIGNGNGVGLLKKFAVKARDKDEEEEEEEGGVEVEEEEKVGSVAGLKELIEESVKGGGDRIVLRKNLNATASRF